MPAYIQSIGTATPQYKHDQKDLVDFMLAASSNGIDETRVRALYRASGIQSRYSVIPDYALQSSEYTFYPDNEKLEPFPDTASRMQLYRREASGLCQEAITQCLAETNLQVSEITHIITVSCTGFYAPGLDIDLVQALGLPGDTKRMAINYMGCYAALNGLRAAKDIVLADADATVLVVSVELCSIHFQKNDSEDAILANALFGDGAAAVLVSSKQGASSSVEIGDSISHLIPDGSQDMAWTVGNLGFEMKLSTYVPDLLRTGFRDLLKAIPEMRDADFYAIHPGGAKIVEAIGNELELTKEDLCYSYEVLRDYGNMSSPTVLFVLKNILGSTHNHSDRKRVLALAFGPGLTLEAMNFAVA